MLHQRQQVFGIHLAGVNRHSRGQVDRPNLGDAIANDIFTRFGACTVSTLLCGQIDVEALPEPVVSES